MGVVVVACPASSEKNRPFRSAWNTRSEHVHNHAAPASQLDGLSEGPSALRGLIDGMMFDLFAGLIAVLAFNATDRGLPPGGCKPNTTHGCLDSTPYDYSKQFPCGSHMIFDYADHLCCEQGRAFDSQNEYCCTGSGQKGVHDCTPPTS